MFVTRDAETPWNDRQGTIHPEPLCCPAYDLFGASCQCSRMYEFEMGHDLMDAVYLISCGSSKFWYPLGMETINWGFRRVRVHFHACFLIKSTHVRSDC